jgi:hypothetical protein
MSPSSPESAHRRSFLGRIAASAGALIVGRWSAASAEVAPLAAPALVADEWLSKIRGTYRQVFDVTGPSNTTAIMFALNFIDGVKESTKATDSDITAVVVFRYLAAAMTLSDAVWAKYKLGEVLAVTDPRTGAPATRNIAHSSMPGRPGLTYQQLAGSGTVLIVVCNHALNVISGMAAPKASVSVEEAKKDLIAGVIPGVHLTSTGVYAVHRAQQAGCTYCGTSLV